jgi:AcrR family transcriptional regulator
MSRWNPQMAATDPDQPPHTARRERSARGEGARLRDELIDAASDLIAESGVEAASLRAVARRAGVSAPSVYLHFDDLEALIQAVVERRFRDLLAYIEAGIAEAPEDQPVERLRAGARGYVRFALDHPGHYRVLFDSSVETLDEQAEDAASDTFGTLVEGIARCQGAGMARPGDPFERAAATWAAMHGLVMLRLTKPGFPWPPVEGLLDDVLTGLVGLPEPA